MKIIGTTLVVSESEKDKIDKLPDIFEKLGTIKKINSDYRPHMVIPNYNIDYSDLSISFVDKHDSLISWAKVNEIKETDILFTYANYENVGIFLSTIPKNAIEPKFKDLFSKIDESKSDFKCNEFGVPIDYDGYNYYDLNNFNIKENVYYLLLGKEKHFVQCTSTDINIMNITNIDKKSYLYNLIVSKKIVLLTNPF